MWNFVCRQAVTRCTYESTHWVTGERYQCPMCDKTYKSKTALAGHIGNIHEGKGLPCDRCGKCLSDSYALKVHMLTHSKVKPFKCSVSDCNMAYTTKQCLQVHYRKAHQYNDSNMPNIVRSVPFTVENHTGTPDYLRWHARSKCSLVGISS